MVASDLSRCWSTNISAGGIGLSACSSGSKPDLGAAIDVEFALGASKRRIRATGRVAWRSPGRAAERLVLGLEFKRISARDRASLVRFLADHRPHVVVVSSRPSDHDLARAALRHLDLHHVNSDSELSAEMIRSAAAIIIAGDDPEEVLGFVDSVDTISGLGSDEPLPGTPPRAPITLCTTINSEVLLPLFGEGKIYEVLRPPLDKATLAHAAERSCERWALQTELSWASIQLEAALQHQRLIQVPDPLADSDSAMVRASEDMRRVYQLIQTVAIHDVPVLLLGETGTGKELAARELHRLSRRANTPFLTQDCGALTETLLESELFGHVKGAFTGATSDHPGLFQIADGGTIFLDEIQNTTPALQAKLLRVVEEGEVRPVGSPRTRRVDVRLIAASNVDLRRAVKEHRFRADFFYRLNRFPIELPPLRQRREDILPLARFFVATLAADLDRPVAGLSEELEPALLGYSWPGNVRELKNAIERAILLTGGGELVRPTSLPHEVRGQINGAHIHRGLGEQVDEFERSLICEALERNDGVVRRAATELQVNAVTLGRKIRRLKIR